MVRCASKTAWSSSLSGAVNAPVWCDWNDNQSRRAGHCQKAKDSKLKTTILIYGRSGAGKSAQIGELSEHEFVTNGKITRLYTADKGGVKVIQPHIDAGLIEVVAIEDTDPWVFLNAASLGKTRQSGKWILDAKANDKIGCWAFESMRAFAENLKGNMAEMAGKGVNIGGGSNINFSVSGDGETLKVSGSNMAHYGVAQDRMTAEIWRSLKLPGDYVVWTSSVSKDEDINSGGKVIGPDVIGKALTTETPRWFDLTYRIDVLPASGTQPERHVLFLGNHVDTGAGGAAGLGNIRLPLDADKLAVTIIEPASIKKALELVEASSKTAFAKLQARLGGKLPLKG